MTKPSRKGCRRQVDPLAVRDHRPSVCGSGTLAFRDGLLYSQAVVVSCVTTELTPAQRAKLGASFPEDEAALLTVGAGYVVIGLQYEVNSIIWGTGAWVQLPVAERIVCAPLCLFHLVDRRPSALWETRQWEDGSLTMWPPSLYRDYYHDDLRKGDLTVRQDFLAVCERLRQEAGR